MSFPARIEFHKGLRYVADAGHNRILAFDENGKVRRIIGSGAEGFDDGDLNTASFNFPQGMAFIGDDLYVADSFNHAIRRVDLQKGTVTTVAGVGLRGYQRFPDNSPGLKTAFASPWDLELMEDGVTLAVANAGTHQLWSYNTQTERVNVLAGNGYESVKDGQRLRATFAQTSGFHRVGGNLYFVDAESSALRVLANDRINTLIGTGLFDFGHIDGKYPRAQLQHPQGLYADQEQILVADTYNNAIRRYDLKTGRLSTIALNEAVLNEPGDIQLHDGVAYIVDTNNHRLLQADLATGDTTQVTLEIPAM